MLESNQNLNFPAKKIPFISLFAGIEAPRVALEPLGFKCVWENEIDKNCCKLLKKHYGDKELVEGDIRNVDAKNIPDHELLVAGFPCQSFSVAGKRKGTTENRGTLFTQIVRITEIKRPKFLLLENVEGLLFNDFGRTFATILRLLGRLGYFLEWQVLNSKDFGKPQNRRRVFIIGHLGGIPERRIFPIKQHTNEKTLKIVTQLENDTPSGLSRQSDRIYSIDGLSPTLTASFLDVVVFWKNELRRLSVIEWERLQGFPDNYTSGFSDKIRKKMLGNTMTVPVIRFLGTGIMERYFENQVAT
jgi:DNA (cytosine-5)-methyltransferase 1